MQRMYFCYICTIKPYKNTIMIALRIKEICKQQGMTLQGLASAVGISQNSISGLATGKQKPSFDTLEKLASALNVEVGELFAPKNDFIAFIRSEGQTHTITSKEELKEFADKLTSPKMCQEEVQEAKSEDSETQGK